MSPARHRTARCTFHFFRLVDLIDADKWLGVTRHQLVLIVSRCFVTQVFMGADTHASRLLAFAQRRGIVRTRDLDDISVPREVLKRLTDRGELMRRSRGIYVLPQHEPTRHTDLAVGHSAFNPLAVI